ncbi:Flp family type IVb pilin [Shinella pollutisoli]|uniref:Flp family type IVb pilin n=1 Tax=Shinella pollutisoli TaxID=2250594 RepID=A0ABV7DBB0_9HYPH|nr:Flp family type IVb pilin [Shinella pollutisoli]
MTPKLLKSFLADRTGATAVEYGLLVSLIAVGLLAGLSNFSEALKDMLNMIAGKVEP